MAPHRGKQGEWPRVTGNPTACYQTPDGVLRSNRELVGPLRMGTAPGCGPRGAAVVADDTRESDFGTDRLRKPVDSIGIKYPETDPPVPLVAESVRKGRRGY